MTQLADDTRRHAQTIEHPWDARALDWPLTRHSVVVEVGGYTGRWALQIAERYQPRLYVFEPQPWAAMVCEEVLGDNALVLEYALGATSGAMLMGDWGTDGCSLVKSDGRESSCEAVEIGATFRQLGLTHIDLLLMNIEGYEYTLLPHMLDKGILPDRLMVQFHTFADDDGKQTAVIFDRLERAGYGLLWGYGLTLLAWERL